MQNRRPAPLNVVPGDPEGTTWALPEGAIARLGKGIVLSGGGPKLALPPGGGYFAVQTRIGLWWYEMSSKSPIALWETKRGLIASADFSPDGEWIAIANWDGILKVMDVQSGECIARMDRTEAQNIYAHVVFSPDRKWIATANRDGNVEVLDVHQGVCIAQMDRGERDKQSNDVAHLEFSADSKFLAATARNPKVYTFRDGERKLINPDTEGTQTYVWHPETGEAIVKFAGRSFVFSPDSRLIACACPDETLSKAEAADSIYNFISVWEIATGERLLTLQNISIGVIVLCSRRAVYSWHHLHQAVKMVKKKYCVYGSSERVYKRWFIQTQVNLGKSHSTRQRVCYLLLLIGKIQLRFGIWNSVKNYTHSNCIRRVLMPNGLRSSHSWLLPTKRLRLATDIPLQHFVSLSVIQIL